MRLEKIEKTRVLYYLCRLGKYNLSKRRSVREKRLLEIFVSKRKKRKNRGDLKESIVKA